MRLILALIAFMAIATPAAADRFALRYEGYALGLLHIGDIAVDVDVSADSYSISTALRSRGLMNWFERTDLRAYADGAIENGRVRWRRYDLDHRYSRKERSIALRAGADGTVSAEIVPIFSSWGEPPASQAQARASRDPLSSVVAMAIDVGQTRGYEGQVLKCALAYRAVAGVGPRDNGRRRVPRGEVWFGLAPNSRFAPPVRINLPISAGGASVRITSFNRAIVDLSQEAASP